MNSRQFYSAILIIFLPFLLACQPGTQGDSNLMEFDGFSVVNEITGRLGMAPRAPFQCYNLTYSADEQVGGKWVAGADGTTLGTDRDGIITTQCGKVFAIRNKITGQLAEFILVDRIWDNDGVNGRRYNNKSNADAKRNDIGPGHTQLDIAIQPYYDLFGGHDPAVTDYEVIGLDTGSVNLNLGTKKLSAEVSDEMSSF